MSVTKIPCSMCSFERRLLVNILSIKVADEGVTQKHGWLHDDCAARSRPTYLEDQLPHNKNGDFLSHIEISETFDLRL